MGNRNLIIRNSTARPTLVVAVLTFLVLWGIAVYSSSASQLINSSFFAGLMTILSVVSGFVAAFYFFAASRGNTFLSEIQTTFSFYELLWLTRHGLLMAVISTIFSYVASLLDLTINIDPRRSSVFVLSVIAVSSYSIGTIWRCTRIFDMLVNAKQI